MKTSALEASYDATIIPLVVESLARIAKHAEQGNFEPYARIVNSVLPFSARALLFLDECRKDGLYSEHEIPSCTALDIDNLAADCLLALGGENYIATAQNLRDRTGAKEVDQ